MFIDLPLPLPEISHHSSPVSPNRKSITAKQETSLLLHLPEKVRNDYIRRFINYLEVLALQDKIPSHLKNLNLLSSSFSGGPDSTSPLCPLLMRQASHKLQQLLLKVGSSSLSRDQLSSLTTFSPATKKEWLSFLRTLRQALGEEKNNSLYTVTAHPYLTRGYTTYYQAVARHEDDETQWNEKQKRVVATLRKQRPASVLDLGCCTGWYTIKAAEAGAMVFGTDIDDQSLLTLGETVIERKLSALPLKLSFEELTKDEKVFAPLYQCDMVLCLALLHHLVIVAGLDPAQTLAQLAALSPKTLILEFIDLNDERIQYPYKHPEAIQNRATYEFAKGNLEKLMPFFTLPYVINELQKYFSSVEVQPSTPSTTRTLLICTK